MVAQVVAFSKYAPLKMGKAKKKRTQEEEAKLPPNRRHQACGRCAYEGEFKNVKRHNVLKHPGLPLKLRNSAFGVGGAFEHFVRQNTSTSTTNNASNAIASVSSQSLQTMPGKSKNLVGSSI